VTARDRGDPERPGRTSNRARLLLAASIAALGMGACLAVVFAVPPPEAASAGSGPLRLLLPDLDVAAPTRLVTDVVATDDGPRARLAFESLASNFGEGPLVVHGRRTSALDPELTADQVLTRRNGQQVVRPDVGALSYVEDPTHEHWHLLPFMSYELRRASDFRLVVPDEKTGFCLGDRVDAKPRRRLPGEPVLPVFNTDCSAGDRSILAIVEGISVGWGDVYQAWRDGQYLDVTGVRSGRYVLVHRVNATRRLQESSYGNNASSLLLQLSWPEGVTGRPSVRVLARCPDTARCPPRRPG
jgi:hypothetical protein